MSSLNITVIVVERGMSVLLPDGIAETIVGAMLSVFPPFPSLELQALIKHTHSNISNNKQGILLPLQFLMIIRLLFPGD